MHIAFSSPNPTLYFFSQQLIILKQDKNAHMAWEVFPIFGGVICKNDATHQHGGAYDTAEAANI